MHKTRSNFFDPCRKSIRLCHFGRNPSQNSPNSQAIKHPEKKVGIFWDLDNKPPNSASPFEAAIKLKRAVSSFGIVRYMVAYANHHAFSYVPPAIKELRNERKVLNHLENKGIIKPVELYLCRVCGRKFNTNDKLIGHFKIHESEHRKRLNQIEGAKGRKRVNLVGKYALKMDKYKNAARDVLVPKIGYGLGDELKRAGFWVKTVSDKPQAADAALRSRMVDLMDRREVHCVVLVSDDSDFVGVLKEARERCVKTVVVGDNDEGALKRTADACFSWRDIIVGKANAQAGSVVGRWRDRDVLSRLEWSYDPEAEKEKDCGKLSDGNDFEGVCSEGEESGDCHDDDKRPWWELESGTDGACRKSSS
ncbi:hypothetical protein RND81_06G234400 [Saponaria officinalis]|uniref:C2H2-type domain-containing protein n=1 Tax=Saponaria officinalis TaxID=3572 RepID=A0AAW1KFS7_SAPOF